MESRISIKSLAVGIDTYVVVLAGWLDEATAPAVAAALQRGSGMTTIVDLIDVSFFDRTGADLLARPNVAVVADRATLLLLANAGGPEHPHVYATLADAVADAVAV